MLVQSTGYLAGTNTCEISGVLIESKRLTEEHVESVFIGGVKDSNEITGPCLTHMAIRGDPHNIQRSIHHPMLGSFVTGSLDFTGTYSKASKGINTRPSASGTSTKAELPSNDLATQSIVARSTLLLEFTSLRNRNHSPLGLYVVPSLENFFIWDAVLFVHQGMGVANGNVLRC